MMKVWASCIYLPIIGLQERDEFVSEQVSFQGKCRWNRGSPGIVELENNFFISNWLRCSKSATFGPLCPGRLSSSSPQVRYLFWLLVCCCCSQSFSKHHYLRTYGTLDLSHEITYNIVLTTGSTSCQRRCESKLMTMGSTGHVTYRII